MLKITYDIHTHQKSDFEETKNTERRVLYGVDLVDVMLELSEIIRTWYEDPAVKSVRFEEISREELDE